MGEAMREHEQRTERRGPRAHEHNTVDASEVASARTTALINSDPGAVTPGPQSRCEPPPTEVWDEFLAGLAGDAMTAAARTGSAGSSPVVAVNAKPLAAILTSAIPPGLAGSSPCNRLPSGARSAVYCDDVWTADGHCHDNSGRAASSMSSLEVTPTLSSRAPSQRSSDGMDPNEESTGIGAACIVGAFIKPSIAERSEWQGAGVSTAGGAALVEAPAPSSCTASSSTLSPRCLEPFEEASILGSESGWCL